MRIEKLIIRETEPMLRIIREIKFNAQGLNLIVDNTSETKEASGNSIGKTTCIKVIDLCLGARSTRDIYYDSDTNSENEVIKEYLGNSKVQAELILFNSKDKKISLKRDLYPKGKRYIDDTSYKEEEYWEELKKILFNLEEKNPTFRQLIPKFVRVDNTSAEGMIKFLPVMTKKDVYDVVYSFLFGLYSNKLVEEKAEINKKLSECKKILETLEKSKSISSLSILKQQKKLLETELDETYDKRNKLSYLEDYKDELKKKRKISIEINKIEQEIQLLDFEIGIIKESIEDLNKDRSNIDIETLKKIYEEAKVYIPNLQKQFEDLVSFHNNMIQNRINFINIQFGEKKELRETFEKKLDIFLKEKQEITIEVLDEGLLTDLNILNKKIEELVFKKGETEKSIELLQEQEYIKSELNKKLEIIDNNINDDKIEEKLKKFNEIFSEYCQKLYGEKYFVAYNKDWKEKNGFPITISALSGQLGTGKKKALIVAFDLAYLKYSELMEISSPRFIIHDKLENTYINQLSTIFEICKEINGQYIVPILRERIDKLDSKIIDDATILQLSEEEKFFKK